MGRFGRFPGLGMDDDEGGGIPGWVWALIAFIVVVLIITLAVLPLGFPCKTYDIYGWCPCNPPENKKYDADKKLCSCEAGYTSTDPKTKPCTQLECTGGKEVKGNVCACPIGYIDNYGTCEKPAPAKTDGSGTPGSGTPGSGGAPLSSPISFMEKTCSSEDRTQVQIGLITSRAQRATRFTKGADYGYGWDWTHPQLCEYSNLDDVTADVYGFCKTGTGYDEKMGHLFKDIDVYGNGGSQWQNTNWWWRHPYSCSVKDNKKTACGVARTTCPTGYNDKGTAGFIVSSGQSYGVEGASLGDGAHTWAHPRLCCPW
jgi:hypothetical protein